MGPNIKIHTDLFSKSTWDICELSRKPERDEHAGSIYITGNGYLGYRGTFSDSTAEDKTACIVSGVYDNADGTWVELVNAPNGLYTRISAVSWNSTEWDAYERSLDFRYGVWSVQGRHKTSGIHVHEERFASMADPHTIVSRMTLTVEENTQITIDTGIDGHVWNLNGNHFSDCRCEERDEYLEYCCTTVSSSIPLCVLSKSRLFLPGKDHENEMKPERAVIIRSGDVDKILSRYCIQLEAGAQAVLEKYVSIYSGNDLRAGRQADMEEVRTAAVLSLKQSAEAGFTSCRDAHGEVWDGIWNDLDIRIEGDPAAQTLLRYNLYQAIICVPMHTDHLPIGARGLSCQAYQGAAFWDQEVFNLPMFLHTKPEIAQHILTYRWRTLKGAKNKAESLGYSGAFYPWVSADTGEEICPSYFFIDVLTGRKIRNHFNDWQIHISPDIAWAVSQYVQVTGDNDFLVSGGAEMVFEIAEFLYSRAHWNMKKQCSEILRVIGPDEYHENVDNNFYTNALARFALTYACEVYQLMQITYPEQLEKLCRRINVNDDSLKSWKHAAETLTVTQPTEQNPVIEQFDEYFALEDIRPDELSRRLLAPDEYWGWPNGIAVHTQVLKQADVLQYYMLFPDHASRKIIRANWEYYEPRTQHGSSLSPAVYAITGARAGYLEAAKNYFIRSCTIDLFNTQKSYSGGTYIGGIHTAACAAAWQIAVKGFAGMSVTESGYRFDPHLPQGWNSMEFNLIRKGNRISVQITRNQITILGDEKNSQSVTIETGKTAAEVYPGSTAILDMDS